MIRLERLTLAREQRPAPLQRPFEALLIQVERDGRHRRGGLYRPFLDAGQPVGRDYISVETRVNGASTRLATCCSCVCNFRAVLTATFSAVSSLSTQGQSQSKNKTHPAPNAKQPPHEFNSLSSSMHSKPILNQSARLDRLLSSAEIESGVTSSPV